MDFDHFLEILWEQDPTGENGFEGLVSVLLENLIGQRFFLSRAGAQNGRDMASEGKIGNLLAVECKRYRDSTELRSGELLAKFLETAISVPPPDVWSVVTTKRLGEQHHRKLELASQNFGITYFPVDAEGSEDSAIATLCASAPELISEHLRNYKPCLNREKAEEVNKYLGEIAGRKRFLTQVENLSRNLMADNLGYDHWVKKQNNWFRSCLISRSMAQAAFRQDIALLDPGQKVINRVGVKSTLDEWWKNWREEKRPLVVLGEEGDGKTWALTSWLAGNIEKENFPPILFVPSIHATSPDDVSKLIVSVLQRQLSEPRPDYWSKRLQRWIKAYRENIPILLLVLDGLNERYSFDWKTFFSNLVALPWASQIAVAATCRIAYWDRHLASFLDEAVKTWVLPPYNEKELELALNAYGIQREHFSENMISLLSKPRYFDLMVRLHERLAETGDVTVERLVYEDWRDKLSRRKMGEGLLSHEDFQDLISGLAARFHENKVLQRTELNQELASYPDGPAVFEELISSRVLIRKQGRWSVDRRYLILGLGLLLSHEVWQAAEHGETVVDEVIAAQLEPHSDMDLKVAICGMAVYHALVMNEYPEAALLSLFVAWITNRNIDEADWERLPAYLPLRPTLYIAMTERLWSKSVDNRNAQDVFIASFLRFGELPQVKAELIPAFERWFGFVHPHGHLGRHAQDSKKLETAKSKVREALGQDPAPGPVEVAGYHLEIIEDEGFLRLSQVALALISHQERAPHIKAMATGMIASVIMGYPDYESLFNWVLRTAPDSIEEKVLDTARQLLATDKGVLSQAAWWLLKGLATPAALKLCEKIPQKYQFKNGFWQTYEEDPCRFSLVLWNQSNYLQCLETTRLHPTGIAKMLKAVAPDPEISIPDWLPKKLIQAGEGLNLKNVGRGSSTTAEDHMLDEIEVGLCAFCPERYAELIRTLIAQLPLRVSGPRLHLAWDIPKHLMLMEGDEKKAIEIAWRDALGKCEEDVQEAHAEEMLFPCVLSGMPPERQLALLLERGERTSYFESHPPRFKTITMAMMPEIAKLLTGISEENANIAGKILWYLEHALKTVDDDIRKELFRLFDRKNSALRARCLSIFYRTEDQEAAEKFVKSDWCCHEKNTELENHWGSLLLCKFGGSLPFDEVLERVSPLFWGLAVMNRGMKDPEVEDYADLLFKVWKSIAAASGNLPIEVERTQIESDLTGGDKSLDSLSIKDKYDSKINFISRDSFWGGTSVSGKDLDDLKTVFDSDARVKQIQTMWDRLQSIVGSQRRKGNFWFGHSFYKYALEEVICLRPHYVKQWISQILPESSESRHLMASLRGFYETLCKVLLDRKPEEGSILFRRLLSHDSLNITDRTIGISSLLFGLFKATTTEQTTTLRSEMLQNCNKDIELFELAFLAQRYRLHDWLFGSAETWLNSKVCFDQVRGLRLLGFVDDIRAGEILMEWLKNTPKSWLHSQAELSLNAYQRNQWAKHWFKIFLHHEKHLQSWAAFRLFIHCVDRRFWLWGPSLVDDNAIKPERREHYLANLASIKKACKNNEAKFNEQFLGVKVKENQVWPWMGEYIFS